VDPSLRIVTRGQLDGLWDAQGQDMDAERVRDLGVEDVRGLLRAGDVRFVVAKLGLPLQWIDFPKRHDFWKDELQPHLVEPSQYPSFLEDFPGEYFYRATEWRAPDGGVIVLCEMYH
jgi:hypothetical protein